MIDLFVRKIFEQLEGKDHTVLLSFFLVIFCCTVQTVQSEFPDHWTTRGFPALLSFILVVPSRVSGALATSNKNMCGMKELKK